MFIGASLDGAADGQVVAGAEMVQQDRERGLGDHRRGGASVRGEFPEPGEQFGFELEGDVAAAVVGRRRARPVQGQLHRLRYACQLVAPVGELRRGDAVRVRLVAEELALPQRVVLVLHRERRPVRCGAALTGRVRRQQVAEERRHRRPVRGDVVEHEDEHVLLRGDAEHGRPEGRFRVQAEALAGGLAHRRVHRVRCHVEDPEPDVRLLRGQDALLRGAVLVLHDHGAQALVPGGDVPHRRGQRGGVELPFQPEHEGDVVGRGRAFQTVEEPQPALGEGQRDHRRFS